MSSRNILEGDVCSEIIKFTEEGDFLFNGTVCRAWNRQFGVSSDGESGRKRPLTVECEAYRTPSRISESMENGLEGWCPFFSAIRYGSGVPVMEKLLEMGYGWLRNDVEYAAQRNRVDVLHFFKENGATIDSRVLHSAVRNQSLDAVKFLLDNECPVDSEPIDWGYGDEVVDELKIRSLELAIRLKNLEIVHQLCSNNVPFVIQTFKEALDTGDTTIVDCIRDHGCRPHGGTFRHVVRTRNKFGITYLLENRFLREEWGFYGLTVETSPEIVYLLLEHGVHPTDEDVDNCIRDHDIDTAVAFVRDYDCGPTERAFEIFFERSDLDTPEHTCIYTLEWLYYDQRCFLDDSVVFGICNAGGVNTALIDWLEERVD